MTPHDDEGKGGDVDEALWRACAALAFDDLMRTVGLPGERLPHLSADDARAVLGRALDASVRSTLRGDGYVPPPAPRLAAWMHGVWGRGQEWARFEVEVRALRAVGVGFAMAASPMAAHFADAVPLFEAFRRGEVRDRRPGPGMPVDRDGAALPTGTHAVEVALRVCVLDEVIAATTELQVAEVDLPDAPLAARLRTPDGGLLDLRRGPEGFLRPVLAPDLWNPMPWHEFRVAVGEGAAWRDNPFQRGVPTGFPSLSMADCAVRPPPVRAPSPDLLEAWSAAALFAGKLARGVVRIGDGAWVACGEPLLDFGLCGLNGRGGHGREDLLADPGDAEWRVTWRLGGHGGLRSWDRVSTWAMTPDTGGLSRFRSFLGRLDLGGLGTMTPTGMFEDTSPGVRLADLDALCPAAARYLDALSGPSHVPRHVATADVAVDLDPSCLAGTVRE